MDGSITGIRHHLHPNKLLKGLSAQNIQTNVCESKHDLRLSVHPLKGLLSSVRRPLSSACSGLTRHDEDNFLRNDLQTPQ